MAPPIISATLEVPMQRAVAVGGHVVAGRQGGGIEEVRAAGRAKVLVVDDEDAVREACLGLVRRLGFEGLGASDSLQGLALLHKHGDEIACVVLDLIMPRLNGVGTLLAMRRLRPGVRVILSSGCSEEDALHRFAVEQPDAFIQKPYDADQLRRTIGTVLAGH